LTLIVAQSVPSIIFCSDVITRSKYWKYSIPFSRQQSHKLVGELALDIIVIVCTKSFLNFCLFENHNNIVFFVCVVVVGMKKSQEMAGALA